MAAHAGARQIKKQLAKKKAEGPDMRVKSSQFANKGEFLDRKKQRFEMHQTKDFELYDFGKDDKQEMNPAF